MTTQAPSNFPPGVEIDQETFQNWALAITVPNLWTCYPNSEDQVVQVCHWAARQGYTIRPRGVMHGWSPTTVAADTPPGAKILLVDLKKYMKTMTFIPATDSRPASVQVQTGATMDHLLAYLEGAAGPDKPGYSFPHTPAPGHLTVGGVLAIDAHGSAIPSENENFDCSYGSLSNQILSFKAAVTDPESPTPDAYTIKTFNRGDADAKAFLAHVGRAFIVEATLQVIENYYLRCVSYTDLTSDVLFAAPTPETPIPPNSLASFLNQYGRIEAIWFPYTWEPPKSAKWPHFPIWLPSTPYPWFKVWSVSQTKPSTSVEVEQPYNYPFSDNISKELAALIAQIISGAGGLTPLFGQGMQLYSNSGLEGKLPGQTNPTNDLWGLSKNTLLYVKDTTLRVTANGYAVQMKKADVQQAVHDFTAKYVDLINSYALNGQYPVNSPLEIRVTSLDDPAKVGMPAGTTAESPVISALSYDEEAKNNNWDVAVWFDVLTVPGTPHSNDFYQELEEWVQSRFNGAAGRPMPEWSKGWAYTTNGPWTNSAYLESIRQMLTTCRGDSDNWNYEVATLAKYDKFNLFTDELLGALFVATT
jgi:hypothetical protein